MLTSIIAFLSYMVAAGALLAIFMFVYEAMTPYSEFTEIKEGNIAAGIAFAGAIIGFTLPLASTIFYTHSIMEMGKWAVVTGCVQLAVFAIMQRFFDVSDCIRNRRVSTSILLSSIAVAVGILNAISISY